MKRACAVFCLLIFLASACSSNVSTKKIRSNSKVNLNYKNKPYDTAAYTYEGENAEPDSCKNDNGCSYIIVYYPVFKKQLALNDTIKKIILDDLRPYGNDNSQNVKDFAKTLKNVVGVFSEVDSTSDQVNPTTYDLHVTVAQQAKNLVIIEINQEESGGAHPNSYIQYLNWNTKTDQVISLDDIMIDNYETKFLSIAEKIFRKDQGLKTNEPLDNYFFKDGQFALNGNFQLTSEGISFFYNTYEIKPYVAGPTELLIPYASIKHLLRPNTVITQYIK